MNQIKDKLLEQQKTLKKVDHSQQPALFPYTQNFATWMQCCYHRLTQTHTNSHEVQKETSMTVEDNRNWTHTAARPHAHTHTRAQYLSELHSFPKSCCCGSKCSTYNGIHVISVHFSRFCIRTDSKPCTSFQSKLPWPWQKKKKAQKGVSAQSWKLTSRRRQFHRNLENQERTFWLTGRKHPCLSLWCFTCRKSSAVQTDATSSYILRLQRSWEIHLHSSHT